MPKYLGSRPKTWPEGTTSTKCPRKSYLPWRERLEKSSGLLLRRYA